jgi:hypothetical protein
MAVARRSNQLPLADSRSHDSVAEIVRPVADRLRGAASLIRSTRATTAPGRPAVSPQIGAILELQRQAGNQAVVELLTAQRDAPVVAPQAPAATKHDAATLKPGWKGVKGINTGEKDYGQIRRIPVADIDLGLKSAERGREVVGDNPRTTAQSAAGRAIALVPTSVDGTKPVEVFFYLHGYTIGYRSEKGHEDAEPDDAAIYNFEGQLEAIGKSGRWLVGILPQGSLRSSFGAELDIDKYIGAVFHKLKEMDIFKVDVSAPSNVLLAGHSGAGAPLATLGDAGLSGTKLIAPKELREVVLFDAINGKHEFAGLKNWIDGKLAADVAAMSGKPEPAQVAYLKGGGVVRFRSYHSRSKGYVYWNGELQKHLDKVISDTKLPPNVQQALHENYKILPQDVGKSFKDHMEFIRRGSLVQDAITHLPPSGEPIPGSKARTPPAKVAPPSKPAPATAPASSTETHAGKAAAVKASAQATGTGAKSATNLSKDEAALVLAHTELISATEKLENLKDAKISKKELDQLTKLEAKEAEKSLTKKEAKSLAKLRTEKERSEKRQQLLADEASAENEQQQFATKLANDQWPQLNSSVKESFNHGKQQYINVLPLYYQKIHHSPVEWLNSMQFGYKFGGVTLGGLDKHMIARLDPINAKVTELVTKVKEAKGVAKFEGAFQPRATTGKPNSLSDHALGLALHLNYQFDPYIGRRWTDKKTHKKGRFISEIIQRALNAKNIKSYTWLAIQEVEKPKHTGKATAEQEKEDRSKYIETLYERYTSASDALVDYFKGIGQLETTQIPALEKQLSKLQADKAPAEKIAGVSTTLDHARADLKQRKEDLATAKDPRFDFGKSGSDVRDPRLGFFAHPSAVPKEAKEDPLLTIVKQLTVEAGLQWGGEYNTEKDLHHYALKNVSYS